MAKRRANPKNKAHPRTDWDNRWPRLIGAEEWVRKASEIAMTVAEQRLAIERVRRAQGVRLTPEDQLVAAREAYLSKHPRRKKP